MSASDDSAAVVDLTALADELIDAARASRDGRASRLLVPGEHQRVLAMALVAGVELGEHDTPKAATLQALRGRARLHAGDAEWFLSAGQLVDITQQRHAVEALEDSVVLLTVTLG